MSLLKKSTKDIEEAATIEAVRLSFSILSDALIRVAKRIGTTGKEQVIWYHCPMAFDNQGADWLQNKEGTENPYYGSKMFKCGSQVEVITQVDEDITGGHQHE
jgi:Cu(I)/Ag(I) efflux system membrane fusion protein